MDRPYDELAYEVLEKLVENGVNETMKIDDLAEKMSLKNDELWIFLHEFQNYGWIGLRMGGFVDLYYDGASAFYKAKSAAMRPPLTEVTTPIYETHIHGPSTNQIGGRGNVQNVINNTNPDLASALTAIIQLIHGSDLSELDKEEAAANAERINQLSQRQQSPDVVERTKQKFDLLKSALEIGDLAVRTAPYLAIVARSIGIPI